MDGVFSSEKWSDFIRSPDDIISELKYAQISDSFKGNKLLVAVIPDTTEIYKPSQEAQRIRSLLNLKELIKRVFDEEFKDFIWECDSPSFHIILPCDEGAADPKYRISRYDQYQFPYIVMSLSVQDSIDDEWLAVSLLFRRISILFPNLCISVRDNDGEILLIEAADCISESISPDNSLNRAWIKGGQVYILENDIEEHLKRSDAIAIMSKSIEPAISEVQKCITERISIPTAEQFGWRHRALCALPLSVERLLKKNPQLIAFVVNSFCSADRINKRKYLSSMSFIKSMGDFSTSTILTSIAFSKTLYGKLNFEPFYTPKALYSFERDATNYCARNNQRIERAYGSTNKSDPLSEAVIDEVKTKAVQLGCKILCGLEIFYQSHLSNNFSDGEFDAELIDAYCKKYELSENLTEDLLKRNKTKEFIFSTESISNSRARESIEYISSIKKELSTSFIASGETVVYDDDSWMFITPEDMDKQLQDKYESSHGSEKANSSSLKAVSEGVDELNRIISGVQGLMASESEYDGVDNRSKFDEAGFSLPTKPPPPVPIDDSTASSRIKNTILLKYKSILLESDDDSDIESRDEEASHILASDIGKEETQNEASTVLGQGFHFLSSSSAANHADSDDEDSDDFYSDDEEDNTTNTQAHASWLHDNIRQTSSNLSEAYTNIDADEESFFEQYETAMDEEIYGPGSTLVESFERLMSPDGTSTGVDIESNLIKHLLESHASEVGGVGPASQLLSQLGLQFPNVNSLDDDNIERNSTIRTQ